jgi:ATP synthase F1 gamma subunit
MPSIEDIKIQLEDVNALRLLSNALLEISSVKIKSLRRDFETNQNFYEEINELYDIVKASAQDARDYKKKKEIGEGKEIHVAITSNKRFYGNLNSTVMDYFVSEMKSDKTEYLVIGNTGRHYIEQMETKPKCTYLSFKNDYPTTLETDVFLHKVSAYNKVILYYPKFVNIFKQEPTTNDITHTLNTDEVRVTDEGIKRIFEPELSYIFEFFETQVRNLLFMRIMLESELSRTAARLVKMNTTENRASKVIEEKNAELRKENMVTEDVRLLETFSSAGKWKK